MPYVEDEDAVVEIQPRQPDPVPIVEEQNPIPEPEPDIVIQEEEVDNRPLAVHRPRRNV